MLTTVLIIVGLFITFEIYFRKSAKLKLSVEEFKKIEDDITKDINKLDKK